MLRRVSYPLYTCRSLIKCPNFPAVIWIILIIDFMRNVMIAGISMMILTLTMEILELHFIHFIIILHASIFMKGFFYLIGGWLADSYIGKYYIYVASLTVTCVIIYPIQCLGVLLTSTVEQKRIIFIVSIFISSMASFGMGCSIPLYSEQFFLPEEEKELRNFYTIVFWLTNLSFLIGVAVASMIVNEMTSFGDTDIAITSITALISDLLYLSIILKLRTKFVYRNTKHKIVEQQIHLVYYSFLHMCKVKRLPDERRRHTFDYADDIYDRIAIKTAKRMHFLVPLILSFLTYWITRAQLHTIWVIQATYLRGDYYFFYLPPQEIALLNSMFNLIFIPIIYVYITPLARIWSQYLKWIGIGFFFMFLSSFISTLLQEAVEVIGSPVPYRLAHIRFYNSLPIPIIIECEWTSRITLNAYEKRVFLYLKVNKAEQKPIYIETDSVSNWTDLIEAIDAELVTYVIKRNQIVRIKGSEPAREYFNMGPLISFLCGEEFCYESIIKLTNINHYWNATKKSPKEDERTLFKPRLPGTYNIYLNNSKKLTTHFKNGGIYSILIYYNRSDEPMKVNEVVSPNSVNLYWILPQYFFSALGDTFAWVPMHSFVYTQSPPYLRAMIRAFHLLGLSFGSGIMATSGFYKYRLSYNLICFTLISFVTFIIYLVLATNYRPKILTDK